MTQQTAPSESIVRKIQLLLNLGERSEGNEAEAAAAMAKAQDLLAQYNLDMATVQDTMVAGGTAVRAAEQKRDYARSARSAMYKWQRELVKTIAETNYCVYWVVEMADTWTSKGGVKRERKAAKRHRVLGTVANTTAVLIMVDYLLETIERLLPYPQAERMSREANLWREGCADRLRERVEAKATAMRQADYAAQGEAAYCTAMQVADLAKKEEAANYDHQYGPGAWARRQAEQAKYEAEWQAGRAARQAQRLLEQEQERQRLLAETPAQRAARERREAKEAEKQERADDRWRERYYARQAREDARRNSPAYHAGRAQGGKIGLNDQVTAGAARKEIA